MDFLDDDEPSWLYRAVPDASHEVRDVEELGEVSPPRPDRVGEEWRRRHSMLDRTDTAYTSWSEERDRAIDIASKYWTGKIVVFKVRSTDVDPDRRFPGIEDEKEHLLEGTVTDVLLSSDEDEE